MDWVVLTTGLLTWSAARRAEWPAGTVNLVCKPSDHNRYADLTTQAPSVYRVLVKRACLSVLDRLMSENRVDVRRSRMAKVAGWELVKRPKVCTLLCTAIHDDHGRLCSTQLHKQELMRQSPASRQLVDLAPCCMSTNTCKQTRIDPHEDEAQ